MKKLKAEDWFEKKLARKSNNDVFLYGLANWHLYETKDTTASKQYFNQILKQGSMVSFAYIAAESDVLRIGFKF